MTTTTTNEAIRGVTVETGDGPIMLSGRVTRCGAPIELTHLDCLMLEVESQGREVPRLDPSDPIDSLAFGDLELACENILNDVREGR